MIAFSNGSGLTTYLVILVALWAIGIAAFALLRIRGNRIRALDEDPRIARSTVIVDADMEAAMKMIEAAIVLLDVRRSSYEEVSGKYFFRTGMTWRTWWQDTAVQPIGMPDERCEMSIVSRTSDTQTIGAFAGGKAAIVKFVRAMQTVSPGVDIEQVEEVGTTEAERPSPAP